MLSRTLFACRGRSLRLLRAASAARHRSRAASALRRTILLRTVPPAVRARRSYALSQNVFRTRGAERAAQMDAFNVPFKRRFVFSLSLRLRVRKQTINETRKRMVPRTR